MLTNLFNNFTKDLIVILHNYNIEINFLHFHICNPLLITYYLVSKLTKYLANKLPEHHENDYINNRIKNIKLTVNNLEKNIDNLESNLDETLSEVDKIIAKVEKRVFSK